MPDIDVKSSIPGAVWKIEVAPGDPVSEDDALMLLESMKMEIPVTAPRDGVVKAILVTEGQQVAEGDTIAVISV